MSHDYECQCPQCTGTDEFPHSDGLENTICPECQRGGKIVLIDDDDDIVSCGYCEWSGKVCQLEWR